MTIINNKKTHTPVSRIQFCKLGEINKLVVKMS